MAARSGDGQLYCKQFYELATSFLDESSLHRLEIHWTPSHHGILGNERADELAKEASSSRAPHGWKPSRTYALRASKELTIQTWKDEWTVAPRQGRFAAANSIPPSLKPSKHMAALCEDREVFSRAVQCRTGHCFSGEYYHDFVPSEPVSCSCDDSPYQDRAHVLQECPQYAQHRWILREVSEDISLPEIMGTPKGILALAKFLKESGAFTKTGKPLPERSLPLYLDEPDPNLDPDPPDVE